MDDLHRDRALAGSFGSAAWRYHRYRPEYPVDLVADLAALTAGPVLDVGCGTGKLAVPLRERGLAVLGVDVDERMASLARGYGVPVEISRFETWADAGRRFQLVVSGEAWHWIDPEAGAVKVAQVLVTGGWFARIWIAREVSAEVGAALDEVYDRVEPELTRMWRLPGGRRTAVDPVVARPEFGSVRELSYRWERTLGAEEWWGMVSTVSDHLRLSTARRDALENAVRACLGDSVVVREEATVLLVSRETARSSVSRETPPKSRSVGGP
ncbi:class I SAM-dependent methyltransferase [Pseudonocardiaceae bacterium YIM PH 21723]|nr:class I SAM-dependent methyltransferase [Pseudonocardiaceae bacterium YIM PH 21723]